MTRVLHYSIMPDYGGAYGWMNCNGTEALGGNHADVSAWAGDHPISEALHGAFAAWQVRFEQANLPSEPVIRDGALDWNQFHAEGLELARRLKAELGDVARVFYRKPREDPDFRVNQRCEVLSDGSVIALSPRPSPDPRIPRKIVAGGQTGVDRAALDWAIAADLKHGGWCPKGRLAADGPLAERYLLQETESTGYRQRTKLNVRDSDATLVFNTGELSGGTLLAVKFAQSLDKPHRVFQLDEAPGQVVAEHVLAWLDEGRFDTLNVAGPGEGKRPGIYSAVTRVLDSCVTDRRPEREG